MKISQHILEAVESLQANMTRTSLTILGIVIGVAALIMMLSVGAGAQHTVMRQIETLGANLLMVVPSVQHNANNPRNGFVQPLQLTLRDVATIASNVPEVAVVAPALQGQARIIYSDRNWLTGINGTTAGYFFIREWPRLCEKSRAIVKLDIFSKTLRTFVVLSGIALTGPKCGTLCARTISRIASNLTR